jgi:hypothetical protein
VRGPTITHPLLVSASDALTMAIENSNPWRTVLGTAFTRAGEEAIGWSLHDLLGHMWLIGKSGRGKTTTLHNLAVDLMRAGFGLGVIDPHGDLSRDLLTALPSSRVRDLVYFDPSSPHIVTFNPVANVPAERVAARAADLLAAFKAVWGEIGWGARMERILYFSIAALIEAPSTTLLSLPLLLKDSLYREKVLRHVRDPIIRAFFTTEYSTWDEDYRATAIDPVLNKVEQLLASQDVRCALGTVTSSIDFGEIMNTRKVFIANLSKGRLGAIHAQLLGALLTSQFLSAALQRGETHPDERTRLPFVLSIDEAGTFTTDAFAEAVSEARKFKLALILANQFTSQLSDKLRSALKANVSSVLAFELSGEDAEEMAVEIGLQKKTAYLLSELPVGEAWIKHAIFGGPFHMYMREAQKGDGKSKASAMAQHVMRNTYERRRVEQKIDRFFARAEAMRIQRHRAPPSNWNGSVRRPRTQADP